MAAGLALVLAFGGAAGVRGDEGEDATSPRAWLRGRVVDAGSGDPVPCRVYVRGSDGRWHHVATASEDGRAVRYAKERLGIAEVHTSITAHPFRAELPPGSYTVRAERGPAWRADERTVELGPDGAEVRLALRRWIDLPARGWFAGDTHVHRPPGELDVVLPAEDLHAAFPLVHWVREAYRPPPLPEDAEATPRPVPAGEDRAYWPRNTEYEIFRVDGRRHTLGAFFLLGQQTVPVEGVPPVAPVGRRAREEGALVELDKHAWPWSMALVPVLDVDLYEVSNNHVWRAGFGFRRWGEPPAGWMEVERDEDGGMTERGWIQYGLQNWYALLDCGFFLRPTAGTASGVHPVPLGWSRVWVHCPDGFSLEAWRRGLDAGRSFVSTGPALFAEVAGHGPGERIRSGGAPVEAEVHLRALAETAPGRLEVVVDGRVADSRRPPARRTDDGRAWVATARVDVRLERSGWIAARVFEERPGDRVRFAHTAPVRVDIAGRPAVPRREEAAFLVRRVEEQIARSGDVLSEEALEEYRRALEAYEAVLERAR